MVTDHYVLPLDEDTIESVAAQLRFRATEILGDGHWNMVDVIKKVLAPSLQNSGFQFRFLPLGDEQVAKVTYNPLTLWVRVDIWADARDRDTSDARYILGHEFGHLLLHDHHSQAFSGEDGRRIPTEAQARSAEWQADRFADHFLMPTNIVERLQSPHEVAVRFGVSEERARSRLGAVATYWERHGYQCFDTCHSCLGFEMRRIGSRVRCQRCGHMEGITL